MAILGVNVDHIATLRQARYRESHAGLTPEPSVVDAALAAEKAGAKGITVHLREDRRHIQDHDVADLRQAIRTRLNLEMAVTPEMVNAALTYNPDEVCLVPENRQEVTTEGGLNLVKKYQSVKQVVQKLTPYHILVSCFIDPELDQVQASADSGASIIELHTGAYANTTTKKDRLRELKRHANAAELATQLGLQINAGHGLNLHNTLPYLEAVPSTHTLNIGHSLVAYSISIGLSKAVREMVRLIRSASKP